MKIARVIKKVLFSALTGMSQVVGASPHNQKVVGSIPSQGPCLNCRLVTSPGAHDPRSRQVWEATD